MNKAILIGNLAADPESRTTSGGIAQCTFRLAVQRRHANASGVREADFLTIVCWRQLAELCQRYLLKGRRVAVEGSIQTRSYDAQDGSKRYVTEINAEDVRRPIQRAAAQGDGESETSGARAATGDGFEEVEDEGLPF
jgi:single-strand DNA-binding protein